MSYVKAMIEETTRRGHVGAHFAGNALSCRDSSGLVVEVDPVEALNIARHVLSKQNERYKKI
jgi:hypothetical protein